MMTPLSYFVISLPELVVIMMICQEAHQQVQRASQLTPTRITNKIERSSKNSSGRDWSTTQCNIRFPKDMLMRSTRVTEGTCSLPTLSLNFILLIMKISQNDIHEIYCKFQSPINSHRNSHDDIHSRHRDLSSCTGIYTYVGCCIRRGRPQLSMYMSPKVFSPERNI